MEVRFERIRAIRLASGAGAEGGCPLIHDALQHHWQGNPRGALELSTQALQRSLDEYGSHSLEYAVALDNMAAIFHDQDNFHEALRFYNLSLTLFELYEQDMKTALVLINRAILFQELGDPGTANLSLVQGLNIVEEQFGLDNRLRLSELANIDQDHLEFADLRDAVNELLMAKFHAKKSELLRLLDQAFAWVIAAATYTLHISLSLISVIELIVHARHYLSAYIHIICLLVWVFVITIKNVYREATTELVPQPERALDKKQQILLDQEPREISKPGRKPKEECVSSKANAGKELKPSDNLRENPILRSIGHLSSPRPLGGEADNLYEAALSQRKRGRLSGAMKLFRRALDINESAEEPKGLKISKVLIGMSTLLREQGQFAGAMDLLERAGEIPMESIKRSRILINMAIVRRQQGAFSEALKLLTQA